MSGLGTGAIISSVFLILLVAAIMAFSLKHGYIITMAARYLRRHSKANLALICATTISTMVITGSLISGDSLRGSITQAAYDNLGEVDEIVTSDRLFNGSIVDKLAQDEALAGAVDHIAPAIYITGIAENAQSNERTRKANIMGIDSAFFEFGSLISTDGTGLGFTINENEVYINQELASDIGLGKGDRINISFTRFDDVIEAIFLGDQSNTNLKVQFKVKDIVKSEGLGRFQLNANRNIPQNVYLNLEGLQKILGREAAINMILISNTGDEREGASSCNEVSRTLEDALDEIVGYEDAKLKIDVNWEKNYIKLEGEDIFFSWDYYELLNDEHNIDTQASSPVITYFWNTLSHEGHTVAYSTVSAFDAALDSDFGLFTLNGTTQEISGSLAADEIILNNWTAERLEVEVGNTVAMNYSIIDEFYNIRYLSKDFTVKEIVRISGKANDSMLMPSFPGIHSKISVFDWDPPFPVNLNLITNDDEDYWQDFSGTPKAFITLQTGADLWSTDIGNITQVRMRPGIGTNLSELIVQVESVLNDYVGAKEAGLFVKTVKSDALESAEGVAIFTDMFLAFSAACIIASAVLIILLIMLRVEFRLTEIGTLRAIGFKKATISNILLVEGTILSIIGGMVGVFLGFFFGFFLITGMNTFWSAIVESSNIGFHYSLDSLIVGFCSGVIISILTMAIALHYEGQRTVLGALRHGLYAREGEKKSALPLVFLIVGVFISISPFLLGVEFAGEMGLLALSFGSLFLILSMRGIIAQKKGKNIDFIAGIFIVAITLALTYYFVERVPEIQLFFVSGFMLLCGFLLMFYHSLTKMERHPFNEDEKMLNGSKGWLFQLAKKNAARKPKRSMFTVLLFSLTMFVLVSLTLNLQGAIYDKDKAVRESGGGYQIMGESTSPVFANLGDESSQASSGIQSEIFQELEIEQFKTKGDVGGTCSNLNPQANPRIIGANESFLESNTFVFTSYEELEGGEDNPWQLLRKIAKQGDIPAVGDYNTVVWILGLDVGSKISLVDENGEARNLKIVGITGNSIFQGSLIIWEENFDILYPTNNGYSLFLFRSPAENLKPQITELENALSQYGFDAYTVESVVLDNILIENTYISVFQVILVFGLIIGTLGFGIVVSRNTMERGREIGILKAIGFTKGTILRALILENSYLLIWAMAIGTISGIVASSFYLVKMNLDVTSWPWLYVAAILAVSYGVAMTSAIFPIFRASKRSVSEAMQLHE